MKYSCGHKADQFLTRAEVQQQKWCAGCDPVLKAKRQQQERESKQRNARTQRELDRVGMGQYGPQPETLVWNPTPEQFFNTMRALSIGAALMRPKKDEAAP